MYANGYPRFLILYVSAGFQAMEFVVDDACAECKCFLHDVLRSKYVSYHSDLDEKLKAFRKHTRIAFVASCDSEKTIRIAGFRSPLAEMICGAHWTDIHSSVFNTGFTIDAKNKSEYSDLFCKKWFETMHPGQVMFMCKRLSI